MSLSSLHISKEWTLFLDRDGVINKRLEDDYVKTWNEFIFLPGVLNALNIFNSIFSKIFVVTNQQGIGKGIMSLSDLDSIHKKMLKQIAKHGGRIDKIYYCPDLSTKQGNCRKPGSVMAFMAQEEYSDVRFDKSIIAGDTESDIAFGKNLGMITVGIGRNDNSSLVNSDYIFKDLVTFANKLELTL